mgnify:FL=1
MLRLRINNNCIYAIQEIKTLLFHKLTISDNNILIVQDKLLIKEIVHLPTPLLPLVPSMTDGVVLMTCLTLCYLLKDPWLAIRQLITNAKVDIYPELWIMLKFMDWFKNHAYLTIQLYQLHNNAKKRLNLVKNIKLLIIVYQKTWKTLNKKSLITAQLSLSFLFIETS